MLILSLCAALIVAICYPETPTGRFIQLWIVDKPALFLADLTFRKAIGWVVFLVALYAVVQALPIELALASALDASAFTEVFVAMGLLAANLRARAALRLARNAARACVRMAASPIHAFGRQKRAFGRAVTRVRKRLQLSSSDEDGEPALAFA